MEKLAGFEAFLIGQGDGEQLAGDDLGEGQAAAAPGGHFDPGQAA